MQQSYIRWGLIAAAFGIVYTLLVYLVNPAAINSMSAGLIPLAAMVFCAVKAGMEERTARGGFISWGQAFTPTFFTVMIYFILVLIFSYFLTTIIDPSLIDEQIDAAIEMQENILGMLGQEVTDEQIQQIRESASPSITNMLMGVFWSLLCFALPISAIIALFIQKKNPEQDLV